MADLIAFMYPDEQTAALAAEEARRLARDLMMEPDAIVAIERDSAGQRFPLRALPWRGGPTPGAPRAVQPRSLIRLAHSSRSPV